MLIGLPFLLMVVAGVTWLVTRRALRPVEGIRAEMGEITASGEGSPTALAFRALAGLQLDVPHFALFVQGNAAAAATSLSVGVRGVL